MKIQSVLFIIAVFCATSFELTSCCFSFVSSPHRQTATPLHNKFQHHCQLKPIEIEDTTSVPLLDVEYDDSEVVTTLPEVEPIVEPVDSKVPKQLDITPPVVSSPEGSQASQVEKIGNAILDGAGFLKRYVELLSEDIIEYSSMIVASSNILKNFKESLEILEQSKQGLEEEDRQEYLNQHSLQQTLSETRNNLTLYELKLRLSSAKLSTFGPSSRMQWCGKIYRDRDYKGWEHVLIENVYVALHFMDSPTARDEYLSYCQEGINHEASAKVKDGCTLKLYRHSDHGRLHRKNDLLAILHEQKPFLHGYDDIISSAICDCKEHASYAKYTKAEKENKKNKEKVTMLRVKENKYKKDISFSKQTSKTISILLNNVKDFIEANDKLIQYGSNLHDHTKYQKEKLPFLREISQPISAARLLANELIEIGETTIHKSQEIKQLAEEILDEVEQLEEKAKNG